MRIIGDVTNREIVQCGRIPTISGNETVINGKFVFDVPIGSVEVNSNKYFYPYDSGSVVHQGYQNLLRAFNNYSYISYNGLLDVSDLNLLDLTATVDNTSAFIPGTPASVLSSRFQTGSSTPPTGIAGNSTALLPRSTLSSAPGLLVTDTIDISAQYPLGTTNFMLYWKIYRMVVTDEVRSNYGITSGTNQPATKTLIDVDQDHFGTFYAAVSVDGGAFYTLSPGHLKSFSVPVAGNQVRIAFISNDTTNKTYLATYAILY